MYTSFVQQSSLEINSDMKSALVTPPVHNSTISGGWSLCGQYVNIEERNQMSIVLKQRHSEQYSPCHPVGDTTPSQNAEQNYVYMEQDLVKKNTFFAVVNLANPFLLLSPPERE